MSTAISPINDTPARVFDRDGQPWFLGMDLLPVMGFANSTRAYSQIDEAEKGYLPRTEIGMAPGRPLQ